MMRLFFCSLFLLISTVAHGINLLNWSTAPSDKSLPSTNYKKIATRQFTPIADTIEDLLGVSLKEKIFA